MSSKETWIRALARTAEIEREPRVTLPVIVDRLAERFHAATAILSPEASLSYAELGARSNRYSRWALAEGLGKGDVVALLAPNCAEYLPMWLGLTRIGATVALLNNQLTGESLAHSIRIAAPKQVLVAAALGAAFEGVRFAPRPGPRRLGTRPLARRSATAHPAIEAQSGDPLGLSEYTPPSLDELALYIYTSGTTGLPKAARVSHHRVMQWSHWFAGLLDTRPEDRMYDCLPLYHSVGGVVATGATLLGGGTVILRPRFSASEFWRDVVSERCTLFQYIGELCRYLLNTPPCPEESRHTLRVACGNGLRPEVWKPFQERFRIPAILEYYAATEANFSLYNVEGEPGAIGRIPAFLAARLQTTLVRVDPDSGEPRRTTEGLCERCDVDEPGEALGLVPEGEGRSGQFEGYTDGVASSKKILRDVLKPVTPGIGPAISCAATRAASIISSIVSGYLPLEGRERLDHRGTRGPQPLPGRARGGRLRRPGPRRRRSRRHGGARRHGRFDLAEFRREASSRLPDYARPVFLRLLPELAATATFKPLKQELVATASIRTRSGIPSTSRTGPLAVMCRSMRYAMRESARGAACLDESDDLEKPGRPVILVTGGAGFIGANFVLTWLKGCDESVLNLDKLTYAGNLHNLEQAESAGARHRFIHGDIADYDRVLALLRSHEVRGGRQLRRRIPCGPVDPGARGFHPDQRGRDVSTARGRTGVLV